MITPTFQPEEPPAASVVVNTKESKKVKSAVRVEDVDQNGEEENEEEEDNVDTEQTEEYFYNSDENGKVLWQVDIDIHNVDTEQSKEYFKFYNSDENSTTGSTFVKSKCNIPLLYSSVLSYDFPAFHRERNCGKINTNMYRKSGYFCVDLFLRI